MQNQTQHPPIEPQRLTSLLRSAGALPRGEVSSVESADSGAFNSSTHFLTVSFRDGAPDTAPCHLILKQNTSEAWSMAAGVDEVNFYHLVNALGDHPPVLPRCFAAEVDSLSGNSILLLEDLSITHAPPITRAQQIGLVEGVPRQVDQEAVIDTLAKLHGYWWDHQVLTAGNFEIGYWSRNEERMILYLERRRSAWERLLNRDDCPVPSEWRTFYDWLFEKLVDFWRMNLAPRFENRRNLTLIHGDAYFANFLCPRQPGAGPAYLLDWQSPSCDFGAYDLVNLLASFWTRAQRREDDREISLLHRYLDGLQAGGVQTYSWDDLCADYRAAIIYWVLVPIQDGGDGSPWSYCQPKINCLMEAFEDWGCAELLNRREHCTKPVQRPHLALY